MEWKQVLEKKTQLMKDVVVDLDEVEKKLLVFLLNEEKKSGGLVWPHKKLIRERLSTLVTDP